MDALCISDRIPPQPAVVWLYLYYFEMQQLMHQKRFRTMVLRSSQLRGKLAFWLDNYLNRRSEIKLHTN